MALQVERADCATFASIEDEWTNLLRRSDADPLTMSWLWQYTWWDTLNSSGNMRLRLVLVRSTTGTLVGIAPLYVIPVRRLGTTIRRLQLLGCCWRDPADIYSEYLNFIVRTGMEEAVTAALLDYLMLLDDWDEFVIARTPLDAPVISSVRARLRQEGCFMRDVDVGLTCAVPTAGSKDDYLRQLGPKTRRAMFDRRSRLARRGSVTRVTADVQSIDCYFAQLQEFHRKRHGRPAFHERALTFHRRLVAKLLPRNEVQLEMLQVDGRPVAVMFNYVANSTCYAQQYSFDEDFDPRVSLGLLYIGFVIEDAFKNAVDVLDMGRCMPGADYKHSFGYPHRRVRTVHAVRSFLWRQLHRVHHRLQRAGRRNQPPLDRSERASKGGLDEAQVTHPSLS